jgi:outer membrane protein OmpA-like peptidoglycan-associated protein
MNTPENYSGRSERQMIVYYNILNILGDRMLKNPSTTIKLIGASEKGLGDGQKMAESVKSYLVDVFSIAPARIATEGRDKPKLPSEQPGQTQDAALILEGDRRVSIESSSPVLLLEFQSGPDAPLKPVVVNVVEEAPIDSYVSLYANGSKEAYESWSAEITDSKGNVQKCGPYTVEYVTIPGKTIMGANKEGTYNVKMIGKTKDGFVVQKDTTVHMVLWAPPVNAEVMRFSVLYGFDESKAITMYEKYITEVIVPKIPQNGTVAIHGHTDMIGDEAYNQKLSLERANDVKGIMQKALAASNRRDVKFVVLGMGEDNNTAPFDNKYPEERFYNRTVIIDLIP